MKKRALLLLLVVTVLVFAFSFGVSAVVIDSGSCGANVTWTYEEDANHPENGGALTIAGKGMMDDYASFADTPWYEYRNYIVTVTYKEGPASVGDYAFYDCAGLELVSLSPTVTSIGTKAFGNCGELYAILIPASVKDIREDMFMSGENIIIIGEEGSAAESFVEGTENLFIPSFKDVGKASDYYFLPVYVMRYYDIVNGVGDDAFGVKRPCTRGQVVTFLWRMVCAQEGLSEEEAHEEIADLVNPFVDVKEDAYYRDGVVFAASIGVTTGTDATHFSPDRICTRAEIVTFLYRFVLFIENPSEEELESFFAEYDNPFVDVTDDDYYRDAVVFAAAVGITTGTDDTHFSPKATCTREQVVTFLFRFIG